MATINELKEQAVTETPLLLFDCELRSGAVERWSTHQVSHEGQEYEARVLRHSLFEMRAGGEGGVDALARVSLTLANADSHLSQIERSVGWKGSRVTVRFLFFDVKNNTAASEASVLFRGVTDAPEEITESAFRLAVRNSLNLQRLLLPQVRIERRCPWRFPSSAEQRAEAVLGGGQGKYSPFYRCGYSAGVEGGAGSLNNGAPFTTCDRSRAQCQERGMFAADEQGRWTRRFGGIEFVPPTNLVRAYGEKDFQVSRVVENAARYNDFVPLVYGKAWYTPPIVFSKNDGNLTRMEVLLGMGEMDGVDTVLVNGYEIPAGQAGRNMTGTGWYNVVGLGGRFGGFNLDFTDSRGNPLGDPYGSMAMMSVVVPNRISDGRSLPEVEALVRGVRLQRFAPNGDYLGEAFTNNPAWVLLDLLRKCGWLIDEIDLGSFGESAAICEELITTKDLAGSTIQIPRFQCNLVLRKQRSAADVIRGIRNASRLYVTYGADGQLQLRAENALAAQQPSKPGGSNSAAALDGGWPAYEFGDGTNGYSGILRRENGEPTIRMWSRSTAETPNRFTLEFQDGFNAYQQDSISLTDLDDVARTGQEISASLAALGVANFDQAARVVKFHLDKSVDGNTYIGFETSVRGVRLRPGDLITVTYLKEGLDRQLFRIVNLTPGMNYRTTLVTAQIHRDEWYVDQNAEDIVSSAPARQGRAQVGLPRPLTGRTTDETGQPQFAIVEKGGDGAVTLAADFRAPEKPAASGAGLPIVSLAAEVHTTGGTLAGGATFYYAVSAVDEEGAEAGLSFTVRATVPPGTNTNAVVLRGLSFGSGARGFHVYRGRTPGQFLRIAANQPIASQFVDTGFAAVLIAPPDENYDHANFHWRWELIPECSATNWSASTIENETLNLQPDAYIGAVARITEGMGSGQERAVTANGQTGVTVAPAWEIEPDATSRFAVAEAGWRFGAAGSSSPVEFEVPDRQGATVHVSGRAANVRDMECAYELSPVTRYRLSGTAGGVDADVPGEPVFGVAVRGSGTIELGAIGFRNLANTRTVSSGTLTVHYWDELQGPPQYALAGEAGAEDTQITLSAPRSANAGELIQIEAELMQVEESLDSGQAYRVTRGAAGSEAVHHDSGKPVYHLDQKLFVIAFPRDFFGSAASGGFRHPIFLPDARVACAFLYVTNAKGNSPMAPACFTARLDRGLRTHSGGQYSIQVEGYLAVQSDAAPPLIAREKHAVGDIIATVRETPTGVPIEMDVRVAGEVYCHLKIDPGETDSGLLSGFGLPAIDEGSAISLDITAVPEAQDGLPGRDLTVTIQL
jgi:hypothetical protein